MKLDKRMSALVSNVKPCRVVADIGCDHGFVACEIAKRGLADKVIASDISIDSVSKADELATKEHLDNVCIRVGYGTKTVLDDECDTLIIAGMGGVLMSEILLEDGFRFNRYILSPQSDLPYFRKFLADNSLMPLSDYKVFSQGKYYDIIVAEKGNYAPSESELLYGSGDGDDFLGFAVQEEKRLNFIISNADAEKVEKAHYKLDILNDMRDKVNESK